MQKAAHVKPDFFVSLVDALGLTNLPSVILGVLMIFLIIVIICLVVKICSFKPGIYVLIFTSCRT